MFFSLAAFVFLQVSSSGPDVQESLTRAAAQFSAGDYVEAQNTYELILGTQPRLAAALDGEVNASERVALAARATHDDNTAIGALLRAQKYVPEDPKLLYDIGVLEDQLGLYQEAEVTVIHLQRLTPADSKMLYLLARVKLDRGQLPEAEEAMREYLKGNPADATAYYGLGRILQLRADNKAATAAFEKSVELKPEQTESQYQLADIALKAGDYTTAIHEAAKVLARDPHHGGALTDTGIAFFRQKQYDQAMNVLQQATIASPAYQPAHYYLGLALGRLGRKEESEQELMTATRLASEDSARSSQRVHLRP